MQKNVHQTINQFIFILSMIKISKYINEKLQLNKHTKFAIKVDTKEELQEIIKERIKTKKSSLLDLNDIDTSNITDMSYLFSGLEFGKIAVSNWDVSNVIDMNHMFSNCKHLKFDNLGEWDVRKVTDMGWMFSGCKNFKGEGLEKWDVSNLEFARAMFMSDSEMNVDLSSWTPKKLQNATAMFSGCYKLNFSIASWDPENMADTKWMTTNTKITPQIK